MNDPTSSTAADDRPLSDPTVRHAPDAIGQRVRSLRLPPEAKSHGGAGRAVWALCLLLATAAAWMAYQLYGRPRAAAEAGAAPDARYSARPADSSASAGAPQNPPSRPTSAPQLESKGYIVPAHQILVSPLVSGRIQKLNVVEGSRVQRGDVLAELESTEYEADFLRAKAARELAEQRLAELENGFRPQEKKQAEAELAEAESQLPQLEAEWSRNKQLRERGTVSVLDYERSESAYRAMARRADRLRFALELIREGPRSERIAAARAEVRQCQADEQKATWKLDNCTLRAPISGTILKKNEEEGNVVNHIAFNGSYSVCDMADLSDLEVDLNIQERDVSRVFVGQACRVVTDAWKDRTYQGTVSRLMPIADRAKGAVPVRVKVRVPAEEEGVYLKPEMSAVVTFLASPAAPATVAERVPPAENPSRDN